MLNCSLQNTAIFNQGWAQIRPKISQYFGLNPAMYSKFKLKGHNGIDYSCPIGTSVFAPMDGIVEIKDEGKEKYGLHIKLRNPIKACEVVLGHLDKILVVSGQKVSLGDKIAISGNSGYSTGAHLHEGFRLLKYDDFKYIFKWEVLNYNNGFAGYIDHLEFIVNWKGGFLKNSL